MIHLLIVPTGIDAGLTSISLGLLHALDTLGVKTAFLKPVAPASHEPERSTTLVRSVLGLTTPDSMTLDTVQQRINTGQTDRVLEDVVALHAKACQQQPDVVVIEGVVPDRTEPYTARLNVDMAKALGADVLLVLSGHHHSGDQIEHELQLQSGLFRVADVNVVGHIINKADSSHQVSIDAKLPPCFGRIPWNPELTQPRSRDVCHAIGASLLNEGEISQRRVARILLGAGSLSHTLPQLQPGTLLVTPADRDDLILAASMVSLAGTPLAGLLLTDLGGDSLPGEPIQQACRSAWAGGLPVMTSTENLTLIATRLQQLSHQVPVDDVERVSRIMASVAAELDTEALIKTLGAPHATRLSPAAFRYSLVQKAIAANRCIVLPEGNEPRTIEAAIECQKRGIARCILLGEPEAIRQSAEVRGLVLPEDLQLLPPQSLREQYADAMVELRKHKQLTRACALAELEDNVVLATMMLQCQDVDGLVSGAVHTTANTIRPALQLIRTAPGARLVSSVFFMGLPDQVLVYGDCAVNPDPNAEELADIAIQSADSAAAMGIEPRVAMISYSTGASGSGNDVEKVRQATALVKQRRADILVDGPLQYDAATTPAVAKSKAPDSLVAGKATVLIFPDLNTGNTTYKAVQRSARVISIGPMLQGLAKPVNDLSRGATVEDIIYTIALTAIQATQI
jgi:phosphate acetyltransferase